MDLLQDHVIGNVLGAALGDAVGCPFEFQQRAAVVTRLGESPWIDGLHETRGIDLHPLGLWQKEPRAGWAPTTRA